MDKIIQSSFGNLENGNLIMEISLNLFNSKSENLKNVINSSLKMIVNTLNIDRCYIFKASKETQIVSKVFEARNKGIKASKNSLQEIPYSSISSIMEKLNNNKTIDIDEIPGAEDDLIRENPLFKQHNTRSAVIMPLCNKNSLVGFFGMDYKQEKFLKTEDTIVSLKILGTLLYSAIIKFESKEKLQKLNKNLLKKIKKELDKNNKQTKMMFQQAKYAQMGEMLSMIAHQWRQPLSAVSSAAVNLKLDVEFETITNDKIMEKADFIEEQTERMSGTINDFMEFFKPEKSKESFSIMKIFLNVQKIIGAQMENRNIKLSHRIDKNMNIYGYKNEFEHVILNLISNARDAYEDKNIKNKEIQFIAFEKGKEKIIKVKDNGGGIPHKIIDKIFNPYFTTKVDNKGTGIGLYMTKTIIERNFDGKIEIENDKNGAVFTIRINNA